MRYKRGFTLIELLTVMAIIALLVGLLLPALAQARAKAQMIKDATQIKQIHAAFTTFSRDYDGIYPTPGLINRLEVDAPGTILHGQNKPGRGPEDILTNNSAHMYSCCIMQNYFTPQILVAPTEPSGFVAVKDDYNWNFYSPIEDIYWDADNLGQPPTTGVGGAGYLPFSVDLGDDGGGGGGVYQRGVCNVSYAHTPVYGDRKVNEWRDSLNSRWAVIGNRGVICGEDTDAEIYNESLTLEVHGGRKEWVGNICFNDNHIDLLHTFYPEGVNYLDSASSNVVPDNIFRNDVEDGNCETAKGSDVFLTLVSEIGSLDGDITSEWD